MQYDHACLSTHFCIFSKAKIFMIHSAWFSLSKQTVLRLRLPAVPLFFSTQHQGKRLFQVFSWYSTVWRTRRTLWFLNFNIQTIIVSDVARKRERAFVLDAPVSCEVEVPGRGRGRGRGTGMPTLHADSPYSHQSVIQIRERECLLHSRNFLNSSASKSAN
jgi:hypothetical protein